MRIPAAALLATLFLSAIAACASDPVRAPSAPLAPAPPATSPAHQAPPGPAADAVGGRLFDKFVGGGVYAGDFDPDQAKTAGAPDGKGGPKGDGTLLLGTGAPLLNDGGHDYRLKNLFGWDLRGKEGIYGPAYMKKPYVLSKNLLAGKETKDELAALLARGDGEIPAFGAVLDRAHLEAIATFVVGVRDGALPHPDSLFTLRAGTPGNYALQPGGDAARGKTLYAARCAGCHGADGTGMLFDDGEYSLGSHARQKAYEDWLKIMNGQPGTKMGRQLEGDTAKEMTQELLDLLAALCDRTAFPRGKASKDDVADADPRCGAYLK